MTEAIEDRYRHTMNALAKGIDRILNGDKRGKDRDTGFVLLVFPFDHEVGAAALAEHSRRCNYISNGGNRKDIAALFREQAAYFEGMPDDAGGNA